MPDAHMLSRALIALGVFLILLGLLFKFGNLVPWLGKLPGDICIRREGFTFIFPVTSSLVISIIISLILAVFKK